MYIYSKQREPTKKRIFQAWSSLSRSTFDKSGVTPTTSQGCRKVWKSGGRRVVTWGSKIRGGGQNLGGRTYTPPPAPPVSYTPTTCCRRSNCWRRKWNKFFFFRILTLALQTYSARFRTGFSSCGVLSQIDLAQISFLSNRWRRIYHQRKPPFLIYVCKRWKILGGIHKLRWQVFGFFLTLHWHFLHYKCWQKVNIFGLLTSSCQRSLWTTPYCKMHLSNRERKAIHKNPLSIVDFELSEGYVSLS